MSSKKLKEAVGKAGKSLREGFAEGVPGSQATPGADGFHEIPAQCPVSGGPLYVSELTCEESGIVIRGKFRLPEHTALDEDKQAFLKVFLRARGVISTVEKELGISYPTVRARLDSLLEEMGLAAIKEDQVSTTRKKKLDERRRQVLKDLEDGKISAEQAKKKLRGMK